ncbi:hypothetical protein AAG747_27530 [Rapidithrix thailandica]|uniref:Uncharacterized protein n=1 Tax=Rapidithrix thailandica TaxID=413964 RepID=A0AAW9SGT0_9BACT
MKKNLWFIVLYSFIVFNGEILNAQSISASTESTKNTFLGEKRLTDFLDSIQGLDPETWIKEVSVKVDSTLNGQEVLNMKINDADMAQLKEACRKGKLALTLAKRIFPDFEKDSIYLNMVHEGHIPAELISFDKNRFDFDKFAISIGYPGMWENDVYFFSKNTLIAKHQVYHRYGLALKHFKNQKNETLIYYPVNYGSGSGTWWFQFNFYKYSDNALLPVLTELKEANLQFPWGIRAYRMQATLISTDPLRLQFVYDCQLTSKENHFISIVNDSTEIHYRFDKAANRYVGDFANAHLDDRTLCANYLYFASNSTELLFIHSHYALLRALLMGEDQEKRGAVIHYLNRVYKQEMEKLKR